MAIQLVETVCGSASSSPEVSLTPQARRLLEELMVMVAVMRRELGLCGERR
jgi:hypothetical protein